MEIDGGGWTAFQRRQDGSVNFYRNWTDYENGFGNLTGEFWLGLSKIYRLTQEGANTLRVDLGNAIGNRAYAKYSTFSVGDSTTEYTLTVGGYSGTAGDSLGNNNINGTKFSTADNNNGALSERLFHNVSCAVAHTSAWWYHSCFNVDLNGPWWGGIEWPPWNGYVKTFSEMKTRRNN